MTRHVMCDGCEGYSHATIVQNTAYCIPCTVQSIPYTHLNGASPGERAVLPVLPGAAASEPAFTSFRCP